MRFFKKNKAQETLNRIILEELVYFTDKVVEQREAIQSLRDDVDYLLDVMEDFE